ncbi:MarR family winged helix-turn-helix transcriptional regulator [Ammoniphilus sp. 3BR4]|uniref:MarR family winged helix-turn-helix transcriptional regulator n=1 Tax=Ammoniphilus sp. 3BR4 TaxID=3158265 RepID=UPI003467ABE6
MNRKTQQNLELIIKRFPALETQPAEILLGLIQTSHEVYHELTSRLAQYGLSQGKFRILLSLFEHERPLNPSELADYAGVTRSTMTGLIDGLEQDELIRRGSLDDRRKVAIHLTEKGKQVMDTLLPLYATHTAQIMSELSKEEQHHLMGLLKKLRVGLEQSKENSVFTR